MKKQGKKIASILLIVSMLLASVAMLSGCAMTPATPSVSIIGTEINADGELIIRYSNGTRENLGVVVGKDGAPGKDGVNTEVALIAAEINDHGELILHYADKSSVNLGVVVGKDGEDCTEPPVINDVDVSIEITGDAESAAAAVAVAAPSVVSVLCNFTIPSFFGGIVVGSGSGVIYDLDKESGDALIITNYHVLYNSGFIADKIGINIYGSPLSSQIIPATFVGGSMKEDIAVLRVQGSELLKNSIARPAVLASSEEIYPGDTAIAIGNARGKGISATYGKINVATEYLDAIVCDGRTETTLRVIRIDAAVNKGNSGGGLFDSEGRLIGIVTRKNIEEDIENIVYTLPIDKVKAMADNIVDYCLDAEYITPYKPNLGITCQIMDSVAVPNEKNGLIDIVETIEIAEIAANGVAEGVCMVGDELISVHVGERIMQVTRLHHFVEAEWLLRPGETMYLKVLRDGAEIELELAPPIEAYIPA